MTECCPDQPTMFAAKGAGGSTEESRAFQQQRQALFAAVCGWVSLGFLVASVAVGVLVFPSAFTVRQLTAPSFLFHAATTLLLLGIWMYLRRGRRGADILAFVDAGGTIGAILLLSLMGATMGGLGSGGLTQTLLANSLVINVRAICVPSSGRRTFAISATSSLAAVATMAVLAWVAPIREAAGPAAVIAWMIYMALWLAASTAVATVASRIIFGLRQEVKTARRIGQYVLERKVGEGGMGVVYAATHAMLRRETAVKLLAPDKVAPTTLARFEREVRQLARLAHPNTVAIYDYGRTPEGTFYYAMEYLDGLDLDELVRATGPLPPGRVVYLLEQICGSLAEAHEMGLVHRDIKPANVIVCRQGGVPDLVKVLDFGLVKDIHDSSDVSVTADASFLGTPLYASPESIRGSGEVTAASDLYAVAAVGYFLLAGSDFVKAKSVLEACASHMYGTPERPSERLGRPVPADLEALIMRGLSKEPGDRPPSARVFRKALLACSCATEWTEEDARAFWTTTGQTLTGARAQTRAEG